MRPAHRRRTAHWAEAVRAHIRAEAKQTVEQILAACGSRIDNSGVCLHPRNQCDGQRRTYERRREHHERRLAHAHEHAAAQHAPEVPGDGARRDRERPDEQADADELERLHALAQRCKGGARHDEAHHEGCG